MPTSPGGRLLATATATVDGAGTVDIVFGPNTDPLLWLVEYLTVQLAGGFDNNPSADADVFAGHHPATEPVDLIIATIAGAKDTASQDPPITVWPGETLRVRWTNADPGDTASTTIRGRYAALP